MCPLTFRLGQRVRQRQWPDMRSRMAPPIRQRRGHWFNGIENGRVTSVQTTQGDIETESGCGCRRNLGDEARRSGRCLHSAVARWSTSTPLRLPYPVWPEPKRKSPSRFFATRTIQCISARLARATVSGRTTTSHSSLMPSEILSHDEAPVAPAETEFTPEHFEKGHGIGR